MNTIKISLYQAIFFATFWYTAPAKAMILHTHHQPRDERDLNLEKVLKIFNDKALSERRLREYARKNKQKELKEILKKSDVDINAKDPFTFTTALHLAVDNGHLKIGKILLRKKNIDINSQDSEGSTPLHLAMSQGDAEYTLLLLENRAKTTIKNKDGIFPHDYTYPVERGRTPENISKKELSFDTKAHSLLLYGKLIPIHNKERQAERVRWNQFHSELLCERLNYLYYLQLKKESQST